MNRQSRRLALSLIKIALPVGILFWLVSRITDDQWEAIRTQPKDWGLLSLAGAIASCAILLSWLRWAVLLRALKIELPMLESIRLGAIGFLLSFASAGSVGGDLFKAFFAARRTPGKRVEAVGSIFVDRGMGLYGLLLVVVVVLAVWPPEQASEEFRQLATGAGIMAAIGTAMVIGLVLGGGWIDRWLSRLSRTEGVGAVVHRVVDPLRMFHQQPLALLLALVMSVGVHASFSLSIYCIARGYYTDAPSLVDHLVMVPAGLLASALPLTPAGLGVFEAALEWLYRVVPARETEASGTLIALTFELVKMAMAALGMVFYWASHREVTRVMAEAEAAEEAAEELNS